MLGNITGADMRSPNMRRHYDLLLELRRLVKRRSMLRTASDTILRPKRCIRRRKLMAISFGDGPNLALRYAG